MLGFGDEGRAEGPPEQGSASTLGRGQGCIPGFGTVPVLTQVCHCGEGGRDSDPGPAADRRALRGCSVEGDRPRSAEPSRTFQFTSHPHAQKRTQGVTLLSRRTTRAWKPDLTPHWSRAVPATARPDGDGSGRARRPFQRL